MSDIEPTHTITAEAAQNQRFTSYVQTLPKPLYPNLNRAERRNQYKAERNRLYNEKLWAK